MNHKLGNCLFAFMTTALLLAPKYAAQGQDHSSLLRYHTSDECPFWSVTARPPCLGKAAAEQVAGFTQSVYLARPDQAVTMNVVEL